MKRLFSMMLVLVLLTACSSGSPVSGGPTSDTEGTYNGELVISNSLDAEKFVSALTTLTVSSNGTVAGTLTTKNPSRVVETGTITGTVTASNLTTVSFDLSVSLPSLGNYTGKGNGVYSPADEKLAGTLTGRDASDTFIGNFIIAVAKE